MSFGFKGLIAVQVFILQWVSNQEVVLGIYVSHPPNMI
jgi:hypothetical protein